MKTIGTLTKTVLNFPFVSLLDCFTSAADIVLFQSKKIGASYNEKNMCINDWNIFIWKIVISEAGDVGLDVDLLLMRLVKISTSDLFWVRSMQIVIFVLKKENSYVSTLKILEKF